MSALLNSSLKNSLLYFLTTSALFRLKCLYHTFISEGQLCQEYYCWLAVWGILFVLFFPQQFEYTVLLSLPCKVSAEFFSSALVLFSSEFLVLFSFLCVCICVCVLWFLFFLLLLLNYLFCSCIVFLFYFLVVYLVVH